MRADVVVVGAGLSGVACARELRAAGLDTRVLDRGRVPGGRMAARTLWDRRVDLGASYLTVSDPGFAAVVDDWAERGLAREWTDTFTALGGGAQDSKTGPVRWGAPHGLRSLVEDLAADLVVERREVRALAELDADAVVLAMPDPQARRLVGDHPVGGRAAPGVGAGHRRRRPVVRPHVGRRQPDRPLRRGLRQRRPRRRPGSPTTAGAAATTPRCWSPTRRPSLAARHLDDPAGAAPAVVQAVRRLLDIGEPQDVHVHRWTFARPTGRREEPYALVDGDRPVGVCGDGWGETPKVETAWLSGVRLGRALAARLT